MMMGFDGYSFCKPHSASYALVAYKSAYLRAHYPAEFMASVISNGGGYYSTYGYISEARRMGLRVLPPDINLSAVKYTGKERDIRVGLMQLKELSHEAKEAIVFDRSRNGPFRSLDDFLLRVGQHVHLQDARVLIKAGCFDAIAQGVDRPGLVWKALQFFDAPAQTLPLINTASLFVIPAKPGGVGRKPGSRSFKDDPDIRRGEKNPLILPSHGKRIPLSHPSPGGRGRGRGTNAHAPYPKHIMLKHESETLGFTLSVHPLDLYQDILKSLHHIHAKDLHQHVGRYVTIMGWLVTGKTVRTKAGDPMKFISFEDTTGIYETVFFPKVYNRFCHLLNAARPYVIKGRVEKDFGSVNINVNWVGFLNRYKRQSLLRSRNNNS
jgi:error-prone DNA polymerase